MEKLNSTELNERGLSMEYGWSEKLARELVECSRQQHIIDNTPKDAGERFADFDAAMKWYESGNRFIYSLWDREDKLAGIIWYGVRPREDLGAANTFAIRLYKQSQGTGASLPFMQAAHHDFEQRVDDSSVWLETYSTNERALRLYESFGYQKVSEENRRVTMVLGK